MGVDILNKALLLALVAFLIVSASANGQQITQCGLVVIAEVKNIEQQPIGALSGRSASYRMANYAVIQIIKGQLRKKEISVSHLILIGKELDELRIGDKVLLCLSESWHVNHKGGRTTAYGMKDADYEGELLLVDSGRR
jgi:hypothetical protein